MTKSALVNVPTGVWTELTGGDVTAITLVHRGGGEVLLQGTTGAAPTTDPGAGFPLRFGSDSGHYLVNRAMSDLFPEGTFDRVWAWTNGPNAVVLVKHA